jgi:hypothetical protein
MPTSDDVVAILPVSEAFSFLELRNLVYKTSVSEHSDQIHDGSSLDVDSINQI